MTQDPRITEMIEYMKSAVPALREAVKIIDDLDTETATAAQLALAVDALERLAEALEEYH